MTTFQNLIKKKKREKYHCVISVISLPRVDLTGCCSSCLAGCSMSHKTLFVLTFTAEIMSYCPARLLQSPQELFVSISLLYIWYTLLGTPACVPCPSIHLPCKPSPTTPVPQEKVVRSGCWSNLGIWDFFFCLVEVLNFHWLHWELRILSTLLDEDVELWCKSLFSCFGPLYFKYSNPHQAKLQ